MDKFALSSKTTTLLNVPGISSTSPEFRTKLIAIAHELDTNPDYLATVISFETGGSFSPTIRNKAGSHAVGLIQFLESTAENLGTTTDQLSRMSAEKQLDYVYRYLAPHKGQLKSLNDVYMAILYPAAIEKDSSTVLFRAPSKEYQQNKGFDKDNKGYITKNDVSQTVVAQYKSAQGERIATDAPTQNQGPVDDYMSLIKELFACGPIENLVKTSIARKILPENIVVIKVNSMNEADYVCTILRNKFDAICSIHKLNNNIEVESKIFGNSKFLKLALDYFFKNVGFNKTSSLPLISLGELERNERITKLSNWINNE